MNLLYFGGSIIVGKGRPSIISLLSISILDPPKSPFISIEMHYPAILLSVFLFVSSQRMWQTILFGVFFVQAVNSNCKVVGESEQG